MMTTEQAIEWHEGLLRYCKDKPDESYWGKQHNAMSRDAINAALAALRAQHDRATPRALCRKELQVMDDQTVYVVCPCVFDEQLVIPSLVSYDPESEDGDEVYLTNNLGGRSTYDECVGLGMTIFNRPPKEDA